MKPESSAGEWQGAVIFRTPRGWNRVSLLPSASYGFRPLKGTYFPLMHAWWLFVVQARARTGAAT